MNAVVLHREGRVNRGANIHQATGREHPAIANRGANESEFSEGAQAAHKLILNRYLTHTQWAPTPTNWIHFTNIGDWGNQVVERSSITEFIQYANNINAAAY
jgi:hypothetical protein